MSTTLWTIGHSNHSLDHFYNLLVQHRIEMLIDVRSSPYSRYASQFNREPLSAELTGRGTEYLFLGDLLGGRVEDERFYDPEGHVLYGRLAESAGFQQGIERLVTLVGRSRAAILCGEEDPTNCHRRLLVGRVLAARGIQIVHLRGDGHAETEAELAAAETFRKTKGQLSLFDSEEPDPWKSTQSVLPKKMRTSSSPSCDGLEFAD
jgi:uncharacterized protein (DUF488 family)